MGNLNGTNILSKIVPLIQKMNIQLMKTYMDVVGICLWSLYQRETVYQGLEERLVCQYLYKILELHID